MHDSISCHIGGRRLQVHIGSLKTFFPDPVSFFAAFTTLAVQELYFMLNPPFTEGAVPLDGPAGESIADTESGNLLDIQEYNALKFRHFKIRRSLT